MPYDQRSDVMEEFLNNTSSHRESIETHRGTSSEVAAKWDRPIDFLFIDGDHSHQGVRADTEVAFKLASKGGVIAWHDCYPGAPAWVGVRKYLEELSDTFQIEQVQGTWLAVLRL